jgi:hypothetical protein
MARKILAYGLPVYLYGLELLVRALANVWGENFSGPTLAGAGMVILLPLTEGKAIDVADNALRTRLTELKAKAHSTKETGFCDFVWLIFFASLLAWMASIFLTFRFEIVHAPPITLAFAIGCAIYIVAIVLSEVKVHIDGTG